MELAACNLLSQFCSEMLISRLPGLSAMHSLKDTKRKRPGCSAVAPGPLLRARWLPCYFPEALRLQKFQEINQTINRTLFNFVGKWLFTISNAVVFLYFLVIETWNDISYIGWDLLCRNKYHLIFIWGVYTNP